MKHIECQQEVSIYYTVNLLHWITLGTAMNLGEWKSECVLVCDSVTGSFNGVDSMTTCYMQLQFK